MGIMAGCFCSSTWLRKVTGVGFGFAGSCFYNGEQYEAF